MSSEEDFELLEPPLYPLCVSVNQTGTRVAIGHTRGFRVYALSIPALGTINPQNPAESPTTFSKVVDHRTLQADEEGQGAIGIVELLYETLTFGVVGGGDYPLEPPTKLLLFSGDQRSNTVPVGAVIRRVRMVTNRAIVLTVATACVVNFRGEKLYEVEASGGTITSTAPLVASFQNSLCAFPDVCVGSVRVLDWQSLVVGPTIRAHQTAVSALAMSLDGAALATASERGTLVRIWNSADGSQLNELRNSSVPSTVRHLGLSHSDHIYCISSGLVKIFYVGPEAEKPAYYVNRKDEPTALAKNQSSYLSYLSFVSSYFGSKWACCEVELPKAIASVLPPTPPPAMSAPVASGVLGASTSSSTFHTQSADDLIVCWWENPAVLAAHPSEFLMVTSGGSSHPEQPSQQLDASSRSCRIHIVSVGASGTITFNRVMGTASIACGQFDT